MKEIFCPLCGKEMYLTETVVPEYRSELMERFSRGSQVRKIEEESKVTMECECGSKLIFNDVKYHIAIINSPEDERVLEENHRNGHGERPEERTRKTRVHFEKKYL